MLDIIVRFIFIPGILIWILSLVPEAIKDVRLWVKECFQEEQVQAQVQVHKEPLYAKEVLG
ncbi:MAG: hypothetical protein BWY74_00044 [Firmicutes bacterium ADurb.Bin419]|nr:MAG: hypothetical protein BWY74_00044 [Firmicutes bacterium ADurb.Bin419]